MKVLHVDTGRTWRGGQQQVFYLHRELTRMGVGSELVASAAGALVERALAAGLPARGMALRGEWDLFSARALAKMLKNGGFTHLHLHSGHAQMIGLLAAAMADFQNVVVTRRVDFIPRTHLVNRWKYGPRVARFVAISRAIRDILIGFGVPSDTIRLVPSGVDPDRGTPGEGAGFREEIGLGPGELLAGNIAHLTLHKGQRTLIDALPAVLERHPKARFVLVGEGELEGELKARAATLKLGDRLLFTGFRRDVDRIMDALDLFVMPSHMEGLGTIVLDALAARKPVVAAAAGGIPEIVRDGVEGLLVPPADAEALAAALDRMLGDEALRRRCGEAGRERVVERFSARAMAEGNLAVYRELGEGAR